MLRPASYPVEFSLNAATRACQTLAGGPPPKGGGAKGGGAKKGRTLFPGEVVRKPQAGPSLFTLSPFQLN